MGRKKIIKTEKEIEECILKRRRQNRINQKNFRLRNKIKLKSSDNNKDLKEQEYKKQLINFLKSLNFNYFITLTTKQEITLKKIKVYLDEFILNINESINLDKLYYIIEQKNRPHIHILIKSKSDIKFINKSIKLIWKKGFNHFKKIYSDNNNFTLEEYLTKEVNLSPEINWGIL
jgi:hypothetical protein